MDKNENQTEKEILTWQHSPETKEHHETYFLGKAARIYLINKMEGWRATVWASEEGNGVIIGTFPTAGAAMAAVEEIVDV